MLLGLFLDQIIVFLVRTLFRLLRNRNTRTWPTTRGMIETSDNSTSLYPLAELTYSYTVNDEQHWGTHKRGFWSRQSADEYARQFAPKSNVVVRYREQAHDKSFVSEYDQVTRPAWATRHGDDQ